MTRKHVEKYRKYSRSIRALLVISGIWTDYYPTQQRFVACFVLFSVGVSCLGVMNFCLQNLSDIPTATKTSGIVISLLGTFLKVCLFLLYQKDLKELNRELSAMFERHVRNKLNQSLALTHIASFSNLFYILTATTAIASLAIGVIIPLAGLIRYHMYLPIIPTFYPYVTYEPGSLVYWIEQLINFFATLYTCSVSCGVDSMFGLYTLQLCGEFRILSREFRQLYSWKRKDLESCVEKHNLLVRSKHRLEKIFGLMSIWLAVTSAIAQCSFIFQIMHMIKAGRIFNAGYICAYLVLKLVQAFMYAWYGELITAESQNCLGSIYSGNWPSCVDNRFKKDILFVLTQKPLTFKASSCMLIRMDIFIKIVETAVSYFFLLKTLSRDF